MAKSPLQVVILPNWISVQCVSGIDPLRRTRLQEPWKTFALKTENACVCLCWWTSWTTAESWRCLEWTLWILSPLKSPLTYLSKQDVWLQSVNLSCNSTSLLPLFLQTAWNSDSKWIAPRTRTHFYPEGVGSYLAQAVRGKFSGAGILLRDPRWYETGLFAGPLRLWLECYAEL